MTDLYKRATAAKRSVKRRSSQGWPSSEAEIIHLYNGMSPDEQVVILTGRFVFSQDKWWFLTPDTHSVILALEGGPPRDASLFIVDEED